MSALDYEGWRRVVFSRDCDAGGACPICGAEYAECPCPGPTQGDVYEYRTDAYGVMWARPIDGDWGDES